ncbi:MAG: hypothetical protein WHV61_10735, partial [Burkholderiales bacterium]
GDPDGEAHVEIALELGLRSGEAVRDAAREARQVLAQDCDEVIVRIALVASEAECREAARRIREFVKGL